MARLWTTGAELNSVVSLIEVDTVYGASVTSGVKHSGSFAWQVISLSPTTAEGFDHQFSTGETKVFARWYVYIDTLKAGTTCYMDLYSGGTNVISVSIENVSGTLTATPYYNNFGAALSTFTLSSGAWHYIEVEYDTSPADGSEVFKVRLDGVEQSASSSLTFTNKTVTVQSTGCYNSTGSSDGDTLVYFDDLAVNNGSGSYQNSYPGEGHVVHLLTNGAGDSNTWDKVDQSAGDSNNYTLMDEQSPDTSTSLVRDNSTSNQPKDLYNIEDSSARGIGSGDTINVVAVGLYAGSNNNTSSGGRNLNVGIKHAGTEYWSGSIDFSISGWRTHSDPVPRVHKYTTYVDPGDSGALTASDLDSLQVGVRTNSSATTLIRISTAWVLVEYVPAGGTNVTAEPSALSLSSSQPSATVSAIRNATITPSALSLVASQPTPTILAVQNVLVSAGVQSLTSSISSPIVTEGLGDSINPSAQDLTASLPSATVTTTENVLIEPAVQALTASQIDPNVSAIQNVTVSPSAQTLAISQASPTVVEGVGVSISASEQDLTLSQPSLTVSTTQNVSETASAQALTVSQAAPTVTAVQNITVSPSVQAITASQPTPVISASGANTYSLDLEASNSEYAYITDANQTGLDLSGDFTIEFNVNFESAPTSNVMAALVTKYANSSSNRSYQIGLYNDAGTLKLQAQVYNGAGSQDVVRWTWTPTTGVWYHIAVTFDISQATASEFELFLDEASQGNGTVIVNTNISDIKNSTARFEVGSARDGIDYFDGKIDELRVWSDIRSSTEISDNSDTQSPAGDNLQGHWRFNGDLLDETGNNNDLTFSSGSPTYSTDVPFGGDVDLTYDAGVQSAVFSQPSPTISTVRNTTISPSVQALTTTQPSPTITAEQNISISPSVQTMNASLGEPVVGGITLANPDVQSLSISLPSPTISTAQNVTISPDVQSLVAVQPTPTITAEESVIISLAAQVLTSSLPSPSVDAIRNVSTTVDALVMSVLQPDLTVEIPAAWVNQPKIDESDNWTPRPKTASDNWTPHAKIASGGWSQRSKTEADGWNPRSKIDGSGSWNSKTKISN
jgi:hypothetical protein